MDNTKRYVSAREQLLEAATALIMQRGYASTGVDDVCVAAGVSKGSFYHHFKSKEDLALHVLQGQVNQACRVLESGDWHDVDEPVARAFACVDHVIAHAAELWGRGCLVGVLAMELSGFGAALQSAVLGAFEMLEQTFTPVFAPIAARAGAGGPTAGELARQLVRVIEGAAVLSRSTGDAAPVCEALRGFRHYLELLARA
jgi:TetR/AcrR family transcriptional repressor of nem operon